MMFTPVPTKEEEVMFEGPHKTRTLMGSAEEEMEVNEQLLIVVFSVSDEFMIVGCTVEREVRLSKIQLVRARHGVSEFVSSREL